MREFNKIIIKDKKLVVVTTKYNGKTIKGVARCAPEDDFDTELGVKLATLRCQAKLYDKIYRNMAIELNDLIAHINDLSFIYNTKIEKMEAMYNKATPIIRELDELEKTLKNS